VGASATNIALPALELDVLVSVLFAVHLAAHAQGLPTALAAHELFDPIPRILIVIPNRVPTCCHATKIRPIALLAEVVVVPRHGQVRHVAPCKNGQGHSLFSRHQAVPHDEKTLSFSDAFSFDKLGLRDRL